MLKMLNKCAHSFSVFIVVGSLSTWNAFCLPSASASARAREFRFRELDTSPAVLTTHIHTNMHASIGLVSCIHRNRMRQIWGLNEFIHLSSFSALSSAAICGFPFLLNVVTIHFMMMILPCNATGFNVPSHENNSRENAFFFSGSGLSFFSWSYIYYV